MITEIDVVEEKIDKTSKNVYTLSIEYLFDGFHTILNGKPAFIMQSFGKNDFMITLRDSIQYKFRSLKFHRNVFKQLISEFNKTIPVNFNTNKHQDLLFSSTEQAMYLVDDLIFHIISLFDYIGNLIGFVFYGDNRRKIKWDGVVTCSINQKWEKNKTGKDKIYKSNVAREIREIEKEIVKKLSDIRADLIHYRYFLPDGKLSINLIDTSSSKLHLYAPIKLQKFIKELSPEINMEKVPLDFSIDTLLEKTTERINELIDKLREDLKSMIKIAAPPPSFPLTL